MRCLLVFFALSASGTLHAQDALDTPTRAQPAASMVSAPAVTGQLVLTEDVIKRTVHEVLAEEKQSAPSGAPTLKAERPAELRRFDALVEDGFRPDCLHKNGLKRQPTGWGPFSLHGYAALPFIAVAMLRGVCR